MARGSGRSNQKLVPEAHKALDALKYEFAAELGLPVGPNRPGMNGADTEFAAELGTVSAGGGSSREDYWGHIASRDAGAVGGRITQHLVRKAERDLFDLAQFS
ncbi:alpha/beta-type small acid-soluble spore protein [Paenibacillus thermotolerans]|uniref:alpha/beta-type small acid-soluble spore protein n=1 Tax=Paenibacillus thermotolerans TaxID=3027807 RepID=UPI00236772E0|nr:MULTISPECIES: alpha/beta-type small acid-soluble spore protein [unclassified Paenibacillus]